MKNSLRSAYYLHLCIVLLLVCDVLLLNNNLALTPPLGWMSWGYLECAVDCDTEPNKCLNEELILSVADHMYNDGYLEAGYNYIVIDDCWAEKERDSNGKLVPDRKRFPKGMKYLADYIHSKSLKFGMYTSVGPVTCKHYPGSYQHEEIDAKTFAEWHVDYLKVDGCFVNAPTLIDTYKLFGLKLNNTGRPIVYSCSWPYYVKFVSRQQPIMSQVATYCNLWRDYHDIFPIWDSVVGVLRYYESQYILMNRRHGPGHWFDLDMLIVGRGALTDGQNRIQMTVYSMLSAPLMMSFDMTNVTESESKLLLNPYLLAINQDTMGRAAKPIVKDPATTVWVKIHHPFKGSLAPSYTFAMVNYLKTLHRTFSFVPTEYDLDAFSEQYTVFDVFKEKYVMNTSLKENINVVIPSSDVVVYSFYPI